MSHSSPPAAAHGLSAEQISRTIDLSRIVLIIGLVFLHYGAFPNSEISPFAGINPQEHGFATWLNSAVLFFFLSAVPLLSMISGWLFFSLDPAHVWPTLRRRMQKRFVSLYLPLVVWNLAVFTAAFALFSLKPDALNFSGLNIDFAAADWQDYGNAVFGLTHPPIAFQFWFVRDLLLSSLLSPLWWLLIRFAPWLGAAALGAAWFTSADLVIFFRPDIPFFFYLGALLRCKQLRIALPATTTWALAIAYLALVALRPFAPYVTAAAPDQEPLWLIMATNTMRIIGVLGFWGVMYRCAITGWGRWLGGYSGLAFFLHSAHWPLLALVKTVLWRFLPAETDGWMLAHYGASVLLTTVLGLGSGILLAAYLPRVFALMNGGRLFGHPLQRRRPALAAQPQEG
jgi:surface polysaccharide O-acyltransferase-like enzyme